MHTALSQHLRTRLDMTIASAAATESLDEEGTLTVKIDNQSDPECTVMTVEGQDQPHLLMTLSGALTTAGFLVSTRSCLRACVCVCVCLWALSRHMPFTRTYVQPGRLTALYALCVTHMCTHCVFCAHRVPVCLLRHAAACPRQMVVMHLLLRDGCDAPPLTGSDHVGWLFTHTHVRAHTHTYTHTHARTHAHTRTHT